MKEIETPTPVMPIQESAVQLPSRLELQKVSVGTEEIKPVTSVLVEPIKKEPIQLDSKVTNEEVFSKEEIQPIIPLTSLHEIQPEEHFAETFLEEAAEGEELEKDFATLEAQKAYYEFIDAARLLDVKSGEGAERFMKAMDDVEAHALEMSIPKLFSLIVVSATLLMSIWAEKMGEEQHDRGKNPKKKAVESEKAEDTLTEEYKKPIVDHISTTDRHVDTSRLETFSLVA